MIIFVVIIIIIFYYLLLGIMLLSCIVIIVALFKKVYKSRAHHYTEYKAFMFNNSSGYYKVSNDLFEVSKYRP